MWVKYIHTLKISEKVRKKKKQQQQQKLYIKIKKQKKLFIS